MSRPEQGRRWGVVLRLLALLALVAAIVVAWRSGLLDRVTVENLRLLADWAGPAAPLAFVAVYALGELAHVPARVFIVAAAVVWPTAWALPLAYLGSLVAATLVFVVARQLVGRELRDAVHAKLPPRMRRYDAALETRGIRTVALIRLLTFMAPTMHWVLATSRVRYRDMIAGTALGVAPGVSLAVLLGRQLVEHWQLARPWVWGAVAVTAVALLLRRLWQRRAGTPGGREDDSLAGAGERAP